MKRSSTLSMAAVAASFSFAQSLPLSPSPCGEISVAKMSVMVMPRVAEGETPRKVWDAKPDDRIAVAKVKEFFQGRGFQTIDFETKLKAAEEDKTLTLENSSDHKLEIMRYSGAEIIVEVDMTWQEENGLNHATIVLKASEAGSGLDMGTTTEGSNLNKSADKAYHAMGAVENQADKFLNQMQANFTRLDAEGRPVTIKFTFAQGSVYNMDSEVATKDDETLMDVLTDWMRDNAYKHSIQQPNGSTMGIDFPEVRVPLRNMDTCQPYLTGDFGKQLSAFMKSISIPIKRTVKGNKILVTVQ
jgi:hypothetical protein